MRRTLLVFSLLFFIACKHESPAGPPETKDSTKKPVDTTAVVVHVTKITGTITDGVTKQPLNDAIVQTNPATRTVSTDASGHYLIDSIKGGAYNVIASKSGYLSDSLSIRVDSSKTFTCDLTIIPPFSNTCTIHLHVMDGTTGAPLSAAVNIVSIFQPTDTVTNATGDLNLVHAPLYTYHFTARVAGYQPGFLMVTPTRGSESFDTIRMFTGPQPLVSYRFSGSLQDGGPDGLTGIASGGHFTEDRLGNPNSAYEFSNTSEKITVKHGSAIAFPVGQSLTFAWWFKLSTSIVKSQPTLIVFQKGDPRISPYRGIRFQLDSLTASSDLITGFGDQISRSSFAFLPVDDKWHFIVVGYDRDLGKTTTDIDGKNRYGGDFDLVKEDFSNSDNLIFGSGAASGVNWSFKIDDIQIFSGLLSVDQVSALYHEGGWQ